MMRLLIETGPRPDGKPAVRLRCGGTNLSALARAADLVALQPGIRRLNLGLVLRGRPPEVHTLTFDDEEPVFGPGGHVLGDPVVQAVGTEIGPQDPPAGQNAPAIDAVERLIDEIEGVVACLRRAYDADLAGSGQPATWGERRHPGTVTTTLPAVESADAAPAEDTEREETL